MQKPLAFVGALSIAVLAVLLLPRSTSREPLAELPDIPLHFCPEGKQCCWIVKDLRCVRSEYTPSRERSFTEFCRKTAKTNLWYQSYDECNSFVRNGGGSSGRGGPSPGTGRGGDSGGDDDDDNDHDGSDDVNRGLPGWGTDRIPAGGSDNLPPAPIVPPAPDVLPPPSLPPSSSPPPPSPSSPPPAPPPPPPPPPPPAPIPPPVSDQREGTDAFLGCYGVDGSWTKDRSLCDLDQARHMRNVTDPETDRPLLPEKTLRNLTEEEEHAIQEALREQFQEEERFKKKHQELLTLIENTVSRFQIIRDTYGLSEQSSGFLDAAVAWLQESAAYFEAKRTKDDVAFMAVSVKELLGRVEELVAAERTAGEATGGQELDIISLIARTEELTSAFRIGFGVLLREGLELPPEVYAAYGEAATKIADIREHCPQNPSSCSGLHDVLEALSTLKEPLQVGMEEVDANARKEIEAAFVRE